MARTSEKVGRGSCPDCGEPVWFRLSSGGKLTHNCEHCDSSGYCEPGGAAYAKRMASIESPKPEVTPPAPAPAATPVAPPKPKRNSIFSMGEL